MAEANEHGKVPSRTPQWDQNRIFFALHRPERRRLLHLLAAQGPKTSNEMSGGGKRTPDTVLKHLNILRSGGLVTVKNNPKDGRRPLYLLAPELPWSETPAGRVIDFGFITIRLEAF